MADWNRIFREVHAADPDTREAWAESVGRADALIAIFQDGNMTLAPPITIAPYDSTFTLPQ